MDQSNMLDEQDITEKIEQVYPYAKIKMNIAIENAIRIGDLDTLTLIGQIVPMEELSRHMNIAIQHDQKEVLQYISNGKQLSRKGQILLGELPPVSAFYEARESIQLLIRYGRYSDALNIMVEHKQYTCIGFFLNTKDRIAYLNDFVEKLQEIRGFTEGLREIREPLSKIISFIENGDPITNWNKKWNHLLSHCTNKGLIDHMDLDRHDVDMLDIMFVGDSTGSWMFTDSRWKDHHISACSCMTKKIEHDMSITSKGSELDESIIGAFLYYRGTLIPEVLDASKTNWKLVWEYFIRYLKDYDDRGNVLDFMRTRYIDIPYLMKNTNSLPIATWLISREYTTIPSLIKTYPYKDSTWEYLQYVSYPSIRPWTGIGKQLRNVFNKDHNDLYKQEDIDILLEIIDRYIPIRNESNKIKSIPFVSRCTRYQNGEYNIGFHLGLKYAMII